MQINIILFARQVLLYLKVVNFVYLISIALNHNLRCHYVPIHYFYDKAINCRTDTVHKKK